MPARFHHPHTARRPCATVVARFFGAIDAGHHRQLYCRHRTARWNQPRRRNRRWYDRYDKYVSLLLLASHSS